MTDTRPRLLILPGASPTDPGLVESLRPSFEVIEVEDAAAAARMARDDPHALVLLPTPLVGEFVGRIPADRRSSPPPPRDLSA